MGDGMDVLDHCRAHLDRLYELMNLLTDLGYDSTGETVYEDTKALETELVRLADAHRGAVGENERLREEITHMRAQLSDPEADRWATDGR
jgi:hypothetical protein